MAKSGKKKYKEESVYDATINRIKQLYKSFDNIVVSFSGGKDSTAVLNMTLKVARELDKLPLKVVFFDEEAIHPTTIEYVERVKRIPDVDLDWYCLEFKHRNACSNQEPFWYTWDKEKKEKWVRDIPEFAITEHKNFKKGMTFQEFSPFLYDRKNGRTAMLTGIRTQESLRRYRVIATKKHDSFIQQAADSANNQYRCFPIYDWSSEDVWIVVRNEKWDYNRTYDIFNKTQLYNKFLTQRVCPPFGEEPLRGLWLYAECFPDMWHKMINRCEGVATAWRYANTELYSNANAKPEHMTYKEYCDVIIKSYSIKYQNSVKATINTYIKYHNRRTKQSIPDKDGHPLSGLSWKFLARIAIRGDFKGRQQTALDIERSKALKSLGITTKEAEKLYYA